MNHQPPNEPQAMPFATWMDRALFDPANGYYARNIRAVGRRGDFSTSVSVSDALGRAVAVWIQTELKSAPQIRTIIEVGGGDGTLMRSVMRATGLLRRWRVRFSMVERSPVLRAKQQKTVGSRRARWFEDMSSALDACEGRALIFHNELLDAFPVTLVQWDQSLGSWNEIWLVPQEGRWREELRPLSLREEERNDFSVLAAWGAEHPPPSDQRCELALAARDWLRGWSPAWRAGAMLSVDYGDNFPALYHRRPRGTLRAYLAHQRLMGDEVYSNMGRQDITADVNFSDLVRWGGSCGLRAELLQAQREFIMKHLPRAAAGAGSEMGVAAVIDEFGAGTAFKTLVQRRAAP